MSTRYKQTTANETVKATTLLVRRGTKAALVANDPIPMEGEIIWCVDENILKIGDGSTRWSLLPMIGSKKPVITKTESEWLEDHNVPEAGTILIASDKGYMKLADGSSEFSECSILPQIIDGGTITA